MLKKSFIVCLFCLAFGAEADADALSGKQIVEKEGIWVGYYLDGQLRFKGRYKNGKRHGRWETKTKYGQKKRWQSGMFKNDVRISD